jgi:hypothetical protein
MTVEGRPATGPSGPGRPAYPYSPSRPGPAYLIPRHSQAFLWIMSASSTA